MTDNNKNKFENIIILLLLFGLFAWLWEQINKSKYHKEIKIALAIGFIILLITSYCVK
ncbi:MAG TPA: hypothetical protein PKH58_12950 [Paludibacteraceae bacterium]|nr:hypothetical protein [Paludibacteraceae bacterium]